MMLCAVSGCCGGGKGSARTMSIPSGAPRVVES